MCKYKSNLKSGIQWKKNNNKENIQNWNIIPTHAPHGWPRDFQLLQFLLPRSRQTLVHELSLYEAHPPLWRKKKDGLVFSL